MPIKFACPAGHLLNVADKLAGREVRCLHCGKMVPVPAATSPVPPGVPASPSAAEAPPPTAAPFVGATPSPTSAPPPAAAPPVGAAPKGKDRPTTTPARPRREPVAMGAKPASSSVAASGPKPATPPDDPPTPTGSSRDVRSPEAAFVLDVVVVESPPAGAAPAPPPANVSPVASPAAAIPPTVTTGDSATPGKSATKSPTPAAGAAPAEVAPPSVPPTAPPLPAKPPPLPGYECPAGERNVVLGIACALGAIAFALVTPACYEIIAHLTASSSAGVARWAFALLALAALHVGYAIYVWQVPDWASVFVVAIVELIHAMLFAFVLGILLAAKSEHGLVQAFDLAEATRSDLARLWCFFALALASAVAFWSGRYGLAWRRRLAA